MDKKQIELLREKYANRRGVTPSTIRELVEAWLSLFEQHEKLAKRCYAAEESVRRWERLARFAYSEMNKIDIAVHEYNKMFSDD